ncbi:hypothetical protein LELG_03325 [Lodderomyces elongisporus NRRL YB-4239]|uniref:Uncharacterized protein n=1 Tax=Lodderomyces elongisporus (strain ATCC 11503 / CBS 2605 / JCM 1781 / NBRC 1676 / NRRL YB-4239) TaxID=379508 RepID=A5E138_LODEL|nr:hypothetical protein LELG_03325 [Lodderomyces elongisporus NRRL YB-4239]
MALEKTETPQLIYEPIETGKVNKNNEASTYDRKKAAQYDTAWYHNKQTSSDLEDGEASLTSNSNSGSNSGSGSGSTHILRGKVGYEQSTKEAETFEEDASGFESCENHTPSPKKVVNLKREHHLGFASTPLHPNNNNTISFLSPMRRLNELHLESEIILDLDLEGSENEGKYRGEYEHQDENEDSIDKNQDDLMADDAFDENAIGNKTIINNSDESDDEPDDESDDQSGSSQLEQQPVSPPPLQPPRFINIKKRQHLHIDAVRYSTPIMHEVPMAAGSALGVPNGVPNGVSTTATSKTNDSMMSICKKSNESTPGSALKFSFSPNDSTPCPTQPKRKKLKFKQASTKNILDLSYARKTSLQELPPKLHGTDANSNSNVDDKTGDENDSFSFEKRCDLESTPISQSTPSSLRASTPPLPMPSQEYGPSINGYKFVKPQIPTQSQAQSQTQTQTQTQTQAQAQTQTQTQAHHKTPLFKYETPENGNRYNKLKEHYNSRNYEILGELPISSAGLMNENEENVHVGDMRINTEMNNSDQTALDTIDEIDDFTVERIRHEYHNEGRVRLPLLPPNSYRNDLQFEELKHLLTVDSVESFFELIAQGPMLDLLKQERIKWHPDKWVGKLDSGGVRNRKEAGHSDNDGGLTMQTIEHLSQIINSLFESYSNLEDN